MNLRERMARETPPFGGQRDNLAAMSVPIGLTEASRSRLRNPIQRRELIAHALVDLPFVVASGLLVALGLDQRVPTTDAVLFLLAAALMGRLEFEVGSGFIVPTQLLFVPMLFVLPPAIVPMIVAGAYVLDRVPDVVAGRLHPQRLVAVLGDAWYAVGPAAVFVIAGIDGPSLGDWPIYLAALASQFACDVASSSTRVWVAYGVTPSLQLPAMRELWLVDLLLSPVGMLAAFSSEQQRYAYVLVVPLAILMARFAGDRHARIDQAIELSSAYRGTALLLADVIEADDEYTGRHSKSVVEIAIAIAHELRLDEDERRLVEFGAMLHDIGKISTPKELINKPGPLGEDEWVIMREHTVTGQHMLDRVGGTLHDVGLIVRCSHEHFDGSGYPDGLAGEQIPLAARVVSVADAYSAMTTRRSYRAARPHAAAIAELSANAGTQFDPAVVAAALVVLAEEEPAPPPARPTVRRR
jgi:putative nucleotidyltransferase with HDIG domain